MMKFIITAICISLVYSCASPSGLVESDVVEEDVKADEWDRTDLVITVQRSLTEIGYYTDNIEGVESDQTLKAVKQYRIDQGLEINTVIDGALERHIDDFLWKIRYDKSIDPRKVAKVIVQNRYQEECARELGQDYANLPFTENQSANVDVYIYRRQLTEEQADYPDSNILIDGNTVGTLKANGYKKITLKPGNYTFYEKETESLEQKQSSEYTFTGKSGETYFLNLSVGKFTNPEPDGSCEFGTRGAPRWLKWMMVNTCTPNGSIITSGSLIDWVITQTVEGSSLNRMQLKNWRYSFYDGETYHYSVFIPQESEIGKCHINILKDL